MGTALMKAAARCFWAPGGLGKLLSGVTCTTRPITTAAFSLLLTPLSSFADFGLFFRFPDAAPTSSPPRTPHRPLPASTCGTHGADPKQAEPRQHLQPLPIPSVPPTPPHPRSPRGRPVPPPLLGRGARGDGGGLAAIPPLLLLLLPCSPAPRLHAARCRRRCRWRRRRPRPGEEAEQGALSRHGRPGSAARRQRANSARARQDGGRAPRPPLPRRLRPLRPARGSRHFGGLGGLVCGGEAGTASGAAPQGKAGLSLNLVPCLQQSQAVSGDCCY